MAIAPPITSVATTVQSVTVTLKDWLATDEQAAGQGVTYNLMVLDQNGQRMRWFAEQGNLVPHLTPEQIALAQTFMADMRMLAEEVVT